MGQTPIIKSFNSVCGHSNVDSASGDVERGARPVSLWLLAWVVCSLWLLTGCVDTAECNATVRCPDEQVCFGYTCRDVCEIDQECGDTEACTPCMADDGGSDEGECFGEELDACVPQE